MPNVSYVTHGTCEEDAKGGVCLRGPSGKRARSYVTSLQLELISQIQLNDTPTRAGRVRELPRSSRSRFKMVWHQYSTWKVRSIQFAK